MGKLSKNVLRGPTKFPRINFAGRKMITKAKRSRHLVVISGQNVWLPPSLFRVFFQLAMKRAYTPSNTKAWIHQDKIIPGGEDMARYVHQIRKILRNQGIPATVIQSNGNSFWRIDTTRARLHFNMYDLYETLEPDLAAELAEYRKFVENEKSINKTTEKDERVDLDRNTDGLALGPDRRTQKGDSLT